MARGAIRVKSFIRESSISTPQEGCNIEDHPRQLRTGFSSVTALALIRVGPSKIARYVPRELLTSVSPFFRGALDGTFAEGLSQSIELPEERVDVFDYFVQWLYCRNLNHEAVDAMEPTKPAFFHLLHLYCLVDMLGVESCKNAIINKVAQKAEETNSVPTPTDTWIIMETFGSVENNPMRRLLVDLFAFKKTDNLIDQHEDEWHPRFMRDLCVRLKRHDVRITELPKPWLRNICLYHEHNTKTRSS